MKPNKNLYQDDALVKLYIHDHEFKQLKSQDCHIFQEIWGIQRKWRVFFLKVYIQFALKNMEQTFAYVPYL